MTTPPAKVSASDDGKLAVLKPNQRQGSFSVFPNQDNIVLRETTTEDFLPSVKPWVRAVGVFMVSSFAVGVGLMSIWPYRVVVRGQGQIRPRGETSVINSPFTGRVRSINVQTNQRVERGQVIAELDSADLQGKQTELNLNRRALEREEEALRRQGRAAVEAANRDVEKAEAALRLAESEYQRFAQLSDGDGAISAMQLDEKRANLEVAKSNLAKSKEAAEETLSASQADLSRLSKEFAVNLNEQARAERNLGISQVRAPVSGVLFSLSLRNPQQVIAEGQEIARISPQQRELIAQLIVPSGNIDDLEIGQRADLRIVGCPYPDFGTMKGRVEAISPDAVTTQRAQQRDASGATSGEGREISSGYEVTVELDGRTLKSGNRECTVKAGMDFTADITTRIETVLQFFLRKARLISGQ